MITTSPDKGGDIMIKRVALVYLFQTLYLPQLECISPCSLIPQVLPFCYLVELERKALKGNPAITFNLNPPLSKVQIVTYIRLELGRCHWILPLLIMCPGAMTGWGWANSFRSQIRGFKLNIFRVSIIGSGDIVSKSSMHSDP